MASLAEKLADSLVVDEEFLPLERVLPEAAPVSAAFDACVARLNGRDLTVNAFLEFRGQDVPELEFRAQQLKEALTGSERLVPGRLYAQLTLVSEEPLPQDRWEALEKISEGHFLSKTVLARASIDKFEGVWRFRRQGGKAPGPGQAWYLKKLAQGLAGPLEAGEVLRFRQEEDGRIRQWLRRRNTWATYLLIILNTAYFLTYFLQGPGGEPDYISLGANNRRLVLEQGQWWRLFSSLFLHFGPMHLAMNMVSLFSVGTFLERLAGSWRFLLIYLVSGLAGSLAGLMNQPDLVMDGAVYYLPSGGASGAVLGLVGALLALHWRRPAGFPKALADRLYGALLKPTLLVFGMGLAAWGLARAGVIPFQLDNWAHAGGLSLGFFFSFFFPLSESRHVDREA